MGYGVTVSSLLHLAILLLVYFGLPSLFVSEEPVVQMIPVAVYPVREETVTPPPLPPVVEAEAEEDPATEPLPEKEPVPIPPAPDVAHDIPPTPSPPPEPIPAKPEPEPRVAEAAAPPPPPPPIPEISAVPPPPPPKPVYTAKVKPKPTLEPKPVVEKKPPPPNLLASLLKSVIASAQHEIKLEQQQAEAATLEAPPQVVARPRISDQPLSASVSDAIRRQVEDNWSVPAGAADAGNLSVEIRIRLQPNGEVRSAEIVDQGRLSDNFYRTMAESARRAVLLASPLRDLPPEKYEQWREITFTFKPPV